MQVAAATAAGGSSRYGKTRFNCELEFHFEAPCRGFTTRVPDSQKTGLAERLKASFSSLVSMSTFYVIRAPWMEPAARQKRRKRKGVREVCP